MHDWIEAAAGDVLYAVLYTGPERILAAMLGLLLIVLLLADWF